MTRPTDIGPAIEQPDIPAALGYLCPLHRQSREECRCHFGERVTLVLLSGSVARRCYPANTRTPANAQVHPRTMAYRETGKEKAARGGFHGGKWWRWRESNSRPEALYSRDYMLSLVVWLSSPRRRRTGCGKTSHLALALHPSDPDGRDRSKCPRCGLRCYPLVTRAERRPVRGPAGLSRQSVVFVVRS